MIKHMPCLQPVKYNKEFQLTVKWSSRQLQQHSNEIHTEAAEHTEQAMNKLSRIVPEL